MKVLCVAVAVVGAVLAWANAASAVVVRDGGFSIDLRGASICVMSPPYVVVLSGARADAAALKAIADQSIKTITLDRKLRPQRNVSELVGRVLVLIAMLIVGVFASIAYRKSSRRRQGDRDARPSAR